MRQFASWIVIGVIVAMTGIPAFQVRADELKKVPADIVDLRLFGEWRENGASGFYRSIITIPRAGQTTFTLQWITLDANNAPSEVRHSLPIREIATLDGLITDHRHEIDAQGLTIYVDFQPSSGAIDETLVIFVNGPGDYEFEGASN